MGTLSAAGCSETNHVRIRVRGLARASMTHRLQLISLDGKKKKWKNTVHGVHTETVNSETEELREEKLDIDLDADRWYTEDKK